MNNQTTQVSQTEREAFSAIGRFGGKATVRKRGKKHMSAIGKKGAEARWGKKTK